MKKVTEYILENPIFPKFFEKKTENYLYRTKIFTDNEIISFKTGSCVKEIQCFSDCSESNEH